VDIMSYWTFSDVFEEQGVYKTPFYGGFGLIAPGGIPKPSFNAFKILHNLGEERIALDSDSALLTRRKDGSLVMAVWNYAPPEHPGEARTYRLQVKGGKIRRGRIWVVDATHGDVHVAYQKMGSPRYPRAAQIEQLRKAAELPAPESRDFNNGELTLTLPSYGLAVLELR
jgi:xylan 1,4-beta-xylosidase